MHLGLFKEEAGIKDGAPKDTRIRLCENFIYFTIFASAVDEDVFNGLKVRSNCFNCVYLKKILLETTFQRQKINP